MPDENRDASEPATCTFTPSELDVPEFLIEKLDGCSRPVWEKADTPRCVWHADGADKPPAELAATVGDGNLSGARVQDSNLTTVSFPESSALVGANLVGANLQNADLVGANLRNATLTGADLRNADLAEASLRGADLRNALLAETTLADVSLSRSTIIDNPEHRIIRTDIDLSRSNLYDVAARANHELSAAHSENGLSARARRARLRELRAWRRAARAEGGRGWFAWYNSLLSKVIFGYGVRLSDVVRVMLLLYVVSVGVYHMEGMPFNRALYYSIVTFTTSPPATPRRESRPSSRESRRSPGP